MHSAQASGFSFLFFRLHAAYSPGRLVLTGRNPTNLPPPRRILSRPSCVYGDDAASHSPYTYVCIAKDPCLRGYPKQVAHFPASCPSAVSMFTGSGLTNLPHPRCIAFRPARPYGEKPNKPSTSTSHALPPDPSLRGITMQD